MTSTKRARGPG